MARPKKTDDESALATEPRRPNVTVTDRSDIISRRIADPMGGAGSLAIPSKAVDRQGNPLLSFYIANGEIAPDHIFRMRKQLGWEFAEPEDLAGPPEDFGFELREGRLVRGVRGAEVLMKMRTVDREAILAAKSDWNRRQALGAKETKATIVERASQDLGDEGADFLHRSISGIEIIDTMEKIPADER